MTLKNNESNRGGVVIHFDIVSLIEVGLALRFRAGVGPAIVCWVVLVVPSVLIVELLPIVSGHVWPAYERVGNLLRLSPASAARMDTACAVQRNNGKTRKP